MITKTFNFQDKEGISIFTYEWIPEEDVEIKAVVQIAHGMAETAARYERFAELLTKEGYIVFANDHRGHGKTAGDIENVGYLGEKDGFDWMVKNMHQLTEIIKEQYPDLPIFLFGHSMGSFLSQRYISLHGKDLKGAVLSGTNGKTGLLLQFGILLAEKECKKKGRKTRSEKLNKLSFGNYNNSFKPNRTEFDWLSSDEKEVDKYINDPYCGGVFTAGFFYDFLTGLRKTHKWAEMQNIPKDLPIYIFAGDKDPVGNCGKGILNLVKMYKKLQIKNVTYKLYKEGRHEMLNEINREEVAKDVISWFNSQQ